MRKFISILFLVFAIIDNAGTSYAETYAITTAGKIIANRYGRQAKRKNQYGRFYQAIAVSKNQFRFQTKPYTVLL